jgi:hypothetical protein
MWMVSVICSGPDCGEQDELVVATLEEAEELACECGCGFVTLAIASFEPVYSGVG